MSLWADPPTFGGWESGKDFSEGLREKRPVSITDDGEGHPSDVSVMMLLQNDFI